MATLLISIVLLGAAPLFALLSRRSGALFSLLDGFVLISLTAVGLLHLLPESMETLGWPALVLVAAGLFLPHWAERRLSGGHQAAMRWGVILALIGLAIHAAFDGVGIAIAPGGRLGLLSIALHRLPMGLFLWWLIKPRYGVAGAGGVLALMAAATVVGFVASHRLDFLHESMVFAVVQALLCGNLMHVVFHPSGEAGRARVSPALSALGAGLAIAALALAPEASAEAHHGDGELFLAAGGRLFIDSAAAILIGFLGAGLVVTFGGRFISRALQGKTEMTSALRGVAFGLPLPICSCGVVPVYRSLIIRGAPPAAALAFLIATPELGIDAVVLSVPLLGWPMTIARVLAAFAIALLIGALLGRRLGSRATQGHEHALPEPEAWSLGASLRYAFVELVDHLGPWILAGIAVAAFLEPALSPELFAAIPPWLQVAVMAVLATPGYICASAATPIAAVFLVAGLSPGAALTFLIAGPATNLTTYGVLRDAHGVRSAVLVIAGIIGCALVAGWTTDFAIPTAAASARDHEHEAWYQLAAAGLLGLLFVASIFRIGPRGVLEQLNLAGHGHHSHDDHDHHHGHAHDHAHDHAHGPAAPEESAAVSCGDGGCCPDDPAMAAATEESGHG